MRLAILGRLASTNGEELHTFSTITTDESPTRGASGPQPVILEKADWPLWLGEVDEDVAALLRPLSEDVLRVCALSTGTNT
jgi:putative SOS response-associated peptidase YedK